MNSDAIQQRMLVAIQPNHGVAPPAKWQQRKSAQTRQSLVQAGVDCLVEGGYSNLTTAAVAERCEVSRGAMHHHFATRMDLVSAVVEEVIYERMRCFLADYFEALETRGDASMIEVATEKHWFSVHSREYAAYLELAVASRTDTELAACFLPSARRYDEVWTREMIEAFPQWAERWEALKLASDFVLAAHLGLLVHEPIFNQSDRIDKIQDLIMDTVMKLYGET